MEGLTPEQNRAGLGARCPAAVGVMDEPCPLPVPGAVAGKERGPCGCRGLAGSAVPCPPLPLPPRSSRHRGLLWGGENHPMSLKTKAQSSSGLFCWEPGTARAQPPVDARGGRSRGAEGGGALPSACPLPVLAHLSWHPARLRGAGQGDARLYPQRVQAPQSRGRCFWVLGFWSRRRPGRFPRRGCAAPQTGHNDAVRLRLR